MSGAGITLEPGQRPHPNDLQEIKIGVTTIADAIGLDIDDFHRVAATETIPVIQITQQQVQRQSASQSVTVEQLYDDVEDRMASKEEIEELRDLVEQLEAELDSEDPDQGKVRNLINSAKTFSSQLAMKMAMLALERGIDILVE